MGFEDAILSSELLLIVLNGIEIGCPYSICVLLLSFNRTKWN